MEVQGFDSIRQSIIDALETIAVSTETVYLRMGQTYSTLVNEIKQSNAAAQEVVADRSTTASESSTVGLAEIIAGTSDLIGRARDRFSGLIDQSNQTLADLTSELAAIEKLQSHIAEIRDDSVQMELVSLNALIIAVRAGQLGRAFSSITSELKILSANTIELTHTITNNSEALSLALTKFKAVLQKTNDDEQSEINVFVSRIGQFFDQLRAAAAEIVSDFGAIQLKTDEVRQPLVQIMVQIQNQDRIRQSLDHVKISLLEIDTTIDSSDLAKNLDDLSFLELLPDLSAAVLDEIGQQIATDKSSFEANLLSAQGHIAALQREREQFVQKEFSPAKSGGLAAVHASGHQLISEFNTALSAIFQSRKSALVQSATLQAGVGDLDNVLGSFLGILAKFRNIDVTYRIEVARQPGLVAMSGNATKMAEIIAKIDQDVKSSVVIARKFYAAIKLALGSYQLELVGRVDQVVAFNQELQNMITKLRQSTDILAKTVTESQIFTTLFLENFAHTKLDLVSMDGLLKQIAAQKVQLGLIRSIISQKKQELMAANNLSSWKLDNDKLKTMVDRFTIFTHKKLAAELGNFEVEAGVESGEITLF